MLSNHQTNNQIKVLSFLLANLPLVLSQYPTQSPEHKKFSGGEIAVILLCLAGILILVGCGAGACRNERSGGFDNLRNRFFHTNNPETNALLLNDHRANASSVTESVIDLNSPEEDENVNGSQQSVVI